MLNRLAVYLLLIPMTSQAYLTGNGEFEFGISKDKSDNNLGLAANYSLNQNGPNTASSIRSNMQLGSDEGRSLVATAAHEYQYEQSFIRTEIYNGTQFYHPGFSWQSQFNHSIDFKNEAENSESEGNVNFKDSDKSWTVSTGPAFTYNKSKLFNYRVKITASKSDINGSSSTEQTSLIGLHKDLSPITTVYLDSSNICTDYSDVLIEDICRTEYTLSYLTKRERSKYTIEAGVSTQKSTETNLYLLSSMHQINSYSYLNIEIQKSVEDTSEVTQFESVNNFNLETYIKESQSLSYLYEWGRKRFEIRARSQESKTDTQTIKTKDASIYYNYQLGSRVCYACVMGLSFDYSDYGNDSEQRIRSLSLEKKHSRRISTMYSFRRTELTNEIDTWSINFLLSYKGLFTNLGKR